MSFPIVNNTKLHPILHCFEFI